MVIASRKEPKVVFIRVCLCVSVAVIKMKYAMIYIASFAFGGVGAWSVAKYGSRLGLLDIPNERSSHEIWIPIPKGGGIGILAAFLLASWVLGLPVLSWICVGFVSLFSLYGDRKEITPKVRLGIQFLGSVGLLFALFYWEGRAWPVFLLIPVFSVFVVGTANYYNFMDGINGIAGITGGVAFGLIALFGVLSGANDSLIILAGCMGFACLGFLPFNMPKARVFMGDVGSVLLGFVFAGMVIWLSKSLLDFICLTAFLFPFYADELTTMVIRIKDGENLLHPHRRHIYQFLANEKGISHWKVSVVYGLLQIIIGLSVLAIKPFGIAAVLFLLGAYFGGFTLVSYNIRMKVDSLYDR